MPKPTNNITTALTDGRVVLFSYRIPVAIYLPFRKLIVAREQRFSVTTSRHINQFAAAHNALIERVSDSEFAIYIQPIKLERN